MYIGVSAKPFAYAQVNTTKGKNKTKKSNEDDDEPKVTFNIFTYTLPFVAFILDHSQKRLNNLPEKSIYVMAKLIAIIYYLGTYVLALQAPTVYSQYYIIVNVNFILFPIFYIVYGHMLRQKKLA
jgi:hypothetical protein